MPTSLQLAQLKQQFGIDSKGLAVHIEKTWRTRPFVDSWFSRFMKKIRADFGLKNFVETGTDDGATALAMSLIFDKVFTCDIKDQDRRIEFCMADNIVYDTCNSPVFLEQNMPQFKEHSLFYLDAHGDEYWPLKDELKTIFRMAESPVVVMDDFKAGNGLFFDSYGGHDLDFDYIAPFIPQDYRFVLNSASHRNRGIIFLFPPKVEYGCPFNGWPSYFQKVYGTANTL